MGMAAIDMLVGRVTTTPEFDQEREQLAILDEEKFYENRRVRHSWDGSVTGRLLANSPTIQPVTREQLTRSLAQLPSLGQQQGFDLPVDDWYTAVSAAVAAVAEAPASNSFIIDSLYAAAAAGVTNPIIEIVTHTEIVITPPAWQRQYTRRYDGPIGE